MKHLLMFIAAVFLMACGRGPTNSDAVQSARQEAVVAEGVAQVGVPAITNFREMKLLKDIYELRDQDGLTTFTYLYSEMTGRLTLLCPSIGYGVPYSTQFTNPSKVVDLGTAPVSIPQSEPNGTFSPNSSTATWVTCADPSGGKARLVYVEPVVVVSPFPIDLDAPPAATQVVPPIVEDVDAGDGGSDASEPDAK